MGILPANILHGAQEQPADVDNEQPLLVVRVTDVNRQSHMDNIVRESRYNIRTALLTLNLLCQRGKTEPLPESDVKAHDKVTDEENIIE